METPTTPRPHNTHGGGPHAGPCELRNEDRVTVSSSADDSGHANHMQWTSHPLAVEPRLKSASLLAILCASAVAAWYGLGDVLYGAVTLVLLTASVSRYLLPTHFAVTEKGVHCSHLWRTNVRTWGEFHRLDCHGDGVFLSPFVRRSRLDSFRGLFLPFAGDESLKANVTAIARARIEA